jgi:hypothetical protein
MIQQINLYQQQFRKAAPALGATRLVQMTAAFAAVLVVLSLALSWQSGRQGDRLAAARQSLAEQEKEVARLTAALPVPQEDPRLREALARLEREFAAKQSFLGRFDSQSLGNTGGFSRSMRGLARRPLPELWLRRIELNGDGALAFEGSALRPDAVPAFVRSLTDEPAFQGREFRTLRMIEQGGRVDFDLRSRERKQ